MTDETIEDGGVPTTYVTLKGFVHAKPSFARDLVTAGYVSNLFYNAAIDRRGLYFDVVNTAASAQQEESSA